MTSNKTETKQKYVIDKGIPIPPISRKGSYTSVLRQMKVGDSVFIKDKTPSGLGGTLSSLKPRKFTSRKVTEKDTEGVRVWRIE